MKNSIQKPNEFSYGDLAIGTIFEFKRRITDEDMRNFVELTADYNPIHTEVKYAKSKGFEDRIVYGMLLGSLFSTLVGMYCPGKSSLYLSQTLKFRSHLLPGQEVTVRGEILKKYDSIKVIVLKTLITSDGKVIVSGEARVKMI